MQLRGYALGVVSYSCADQAHCPLTIAGLYNWALLPVPCMRLLAWHL